MPKYVIERDLPGIGQSSEEDLKSISIKSCAVLDTMPPDIKWNHSYVTGNKIYCVYDSPNEDMIREHAEKGGFPANVISEVSAIISPETAKIEGRTYFNHPFFEKKTRMNSRVFSHNSSR